MTTKTEIKQNGRGDSINNLNSSILNITSVSNEDRIYTYAEAINLAGNGSYSIGLLATLSICTLAMGVDMFGFSVIVSGCTCDFGLDISQTGILLSMPFIGPIVMAYPWGYISDTKGRRRSLLIAMWVSFVVATIGAFSPNWVVMAALKFISTSFCSCAQSASYTLFGESCAERVRDSYMLIMTSVLDFSLAAYVAVAYWILNLDFTYNLGVITFTPWRLLALALALPLGFGAFGTQFFYESPKFLVNVQRDDEAVDILRKMWRRNNGKGEKYPVKRIILNEEGNERRKDASLLQSLWKQIVPLFKPPLLWKSIMLYFFTAVIFSTNNSFFIWFPYLAEKFSAGLNAMEADDETGLCKMIVGNANVTAQAFKCKSTMEISLVWASLAQGVSFVIIMLIVTKLAHRKKALMIIIMTFSALSAIGAFKCKSTMEISLVWASLAQGVSFVIIMLIVTKLAHRKKALMIIIMTFSALSAIGAVLIKDNLTSFIMFFGLLTNELCIGIIYTYFVDMYPTSYRGMAACIGVMVARLSALGGVNVLGAFIMSHCTSMFYVCGGLMLVAAAFSFLLPPDIRKK